MRKKFAARLNRKGFTLIELIVVIAILAILASLLVPSMINYISDSRRATARTNCRTAYSAVATAYAEVMVDKSITSNDDKISKCADLSKELMGNSFDTSLVVITYKNGNFDDGLDKVTYGDYFYATADGAIYET